MAQPPYGNYPNGDATSNSASGMQPAYSPYGQPSSSPYRPTGPVYQQPLQPTPPTLSTPARVPAPGGVAPAPAYSPPAYNSGGASYNPSTVGSAYVPAQQGSSAYAPTQYQQGASPYPAPTNFAPPQTYAPPPQQQQSPYAPLSQQQPFQQAYTQPPAYATAMQQQGPPQLPQNPPPPSAPPGQIQQLQQYGTQPQFPNQQYSASPPPQAPYGGQPTAYAPEQAPYGVNGQSTASTPAYPPPGDFSTPNMRQGSFTSPAASPTANETATRKSRIDPKQIPRQETEKVGDPTITYYTCSDAIPPPSTSQYRVVDQGNCSPRFLRLTTNMVAASDDLVASTKLVVGAVLQPLANVGVGEEPVPVVTPGPDGPVRCQRCRAYMNAFMKFTDSGESFICCLCQHKNKVPEHYACNLDGKGVRRDKEERPELCRGSVEYAVGPEFITKPIEDPCYLIVLDVSYASVASGLLNSALDGVRISLDTMAQYCPRARVGIITFDSSVHFYAIKPTRNEPQMLVVSDTQDVFVPAPSEELIVSLADAKGRANIDAVLTLIPTIYAQRPSKGTALGAAVQAATEALQKTGGKLLVFQSNLPDVGVGQLAPRDDISYYYTDKERLLLCSQSDFYQQLATQCATSGISVDVYVAANSYVDVASIGALSTSTGGQIWFYEGFTAPKHGEALREDVFHNLTRLTGYDGMMIVRCSNGLKVSEYYGNMFRRRPNELELPTVDCDKAFGITLKHEGKLVDKSDAVIQCALLYTTEAGHRRIRVHTICVPVTTALANIFRYADLDAIVALSLKQACRQSLFTETPTKVRDALTEACIDCLAVYRKFCASATSPGQLILPEPLKLLPISTLGMIKNPLFHYGQRADERAFLYSYVASMPSYVALPFLCPRLYDLVAIPDKYCMPMEDGRVFLPPVLTLSSESVKKDGLYLLDDGRFLYIWIGDDLDESVFREVFETEIDEAKRTKLRLSQSHANEPEHISSRIHTLIYQLRKHKPNFPNLHIIARKHKYHSMQDPKKELLGPTLDESMFFKHLLEDAGGLHDYSSQLDAVKEEGAVKKKQNDPCMMSYIDFLCHIHRRIQEKVY